MIRNICYELLHKTELTTDIVIKFEDNKIDKIQYALIKNQLKDYGPSISSEYTITLNLEYDEVKQILYIGLIISIPKAKNVLLEQIINEQSYQFIQFYEKTIELFNSKNKKRDP